MTISMVDVLPVVDAALAKLEDADIEDNIAELATSHCTGGAVLERRAGLYSTPVSGSTKCRVPVSQVKPLPCVKTLLPQ